MNKTADHIEQMPTPAPTTSVAGGTHDAGWLSVLEQITDKLRQLQTSPLLAHDVVAQSIFRDMIFASDMEAISQQCDLLIERIHTLLQEPQSSYVEVDADASTRSPRVMLQL